MGLVKLNDVFDVEETEEDKKYTTKVGVPQVINHYMNIKRHSNGCIAYYTKDSMR